MDAFRQDFRHALRFLRQRPLFTLVSAVSIAIGVGATTSIFSVVNAVLLRPPAGLHGLDRVVEVGRTQGGRGFDTFGYAELLDFRASDAPFDGLAGVRQETVSYSAGGESEQILAVAVSQPYFDIMGVAPEAGRFFLPDEDVVVGANPVAVVSWRFWQDRLGGAGDAVGRTIEISRRPFIIVGIAPREFRGHVIAIAPDVWVPLTMYGALRPGAEARFDEPRSSWFSMVGRLAPGASIEQARQSLRAVMERREPRREDARNVRSADVQALGALPAPARPIVAGFLGMLGGLVVIVLLVTCANVAGMLLARAAARERDIAIRLALGSGRRRLVRQLVLEAVLLFGIGGIGGVALAWWITGLLSAIPLPSPVPLEFSARPDVLVMAAGLGLALLTGLGFGLVPALQASRPDLTGALKLEGRRTGSRTGRMRRIFVTAQVGLSLVLLLAAGLFLRSLQRASGIDTGFDPAGVRMVSFDLSMDGYDEARGLAFLEQLRQRVLAMPGVTDAGVATELPLDLSRSGSAIFPEGYSDDAGRAYIGTDFSIVGAGYFETAGIRVARGRTFTTADRVGAMRVAIVSRTLAERVWPGEDALGRELRFDGEDAPVMTVVGIADDVKNSTLMEAAEPMTYLPIAQNYRPAVTLLARSRSEADIARALRETVLSVDPRLALSPVQSFAAYTSIGVLPQRLAAAITGGLGMLALLLSALGIYGVIAYAVAQRTREIGVRMALGAGARDVIRIIVRDGLRLALPGLLFGAVVGLGLAFLIRGFILGVAPVDPLAFLLAPGALLLTVILASAGPAGRAARIEPSRALRTD